MALTETLLSWAGFTTKCKLPLETMETQLIESSDCLLTVEEGLEAATDLECPSTLSVKKGQIGQRPIETSLGPILYEAWVRGFAVQSNFARKHAAYVAMSSSMQLITTRISEGLYSSTWQITAKGIRLLNELDIINDDEEHYEDRGC